MTAAPCTAYVYLEEGEHSEAVTCERPLNHERTAGHMGTVERETVADRPRGGKAVRVAIITLTWR